jgi:hypothetical protein
MSKLLEKYLKAEERPEGTPRIITESELKEFAEKAPKKEGTVQIEIVCSREAEKALIPLLLELRKLGSVGASRSIEIKDWDGRTRFDFDGDGSCKIHSIGSLTK